MILKNRTKTFLTIVVVTMAILSTSASAAKMSASPVAPSIDGEDISNYGTVTGTDKWWCDNETSGRPKGQTFTTGDTALYLYAFTYQVADTHLVEPEKKYVIRVGTINRVDPGDTATWVFTEIYHEEAIQDFTWNGGEYMTWTLANPLLLSPETEYGIDVGMTSSTSAWQTGIPYINRTANEYTGGTRYMSGVTGLGIGDTTMNNVDGDMLFHIDLDIADFRCPRALSASGGAANSVTLTWQNGEEIPTSVRILRNGTVIEEAAPAEPSSYIDTDAQPGLIEYELIFTMPGDECESLITKYYACITDLAATHSEAGVELTWVNNLAYPGIEIKRDGEVLEASLAGTEDTYTDPNPPSGTFVTYTVAPTNGTCAPAATVVVDMNVVRNAGFEEPVLNDGDRTEVDGQYWKLGYYDVMDPEVWIPGGSNAGVSNPDAVDGFSNSDAYAGSNTGWATSSLGIDFGLSQILDVTLEADTEYVLSVQVGNALYNKSDITAQNRIELLAGGILLASDSKDSPGADDWELHSLTYNSANNPELVGENLEIRLIAVEYVDGGGGDGYQVDFDEVTLTLSGSQGTSFLRGDTNADGSKNLADAIFLLSHLFAGGENPTCMDTTDANDDGKVNLADAISILSYLFANGDDLADPFGICGVDPTDDALDCGSYEPCSKEKL